MHRFLLFTTSVFFFVVGCGNTTTPESSDSAVPVPERKNSLSSQTRIATSQQEHNTAIPEDLTFTIINQTTIPGIKRSLDIRLNKKTSKEILKSIAMNLKNSDTTSYERTFIGYYLPEMKINAGYWATTHFNPNLKINILGLSEDEEHTLFNTKVPSQGRLIGKWKGSISFFQLNQSEDKYSLFEYFADGTSREFALKEIDNRGSKRLVEIHDDGTIKGEYSYVVKQNGDLALYEGPTFVTVYKALTFEE